MLHVQNGILSHFKKEVNPAIFDSTDGPRGHYVKVK